MGAAEFTNVVRVEETKAKTMSEAFLQARDEAAYESGHGGYTGTIAEKHGCQDVTPRGKLPTRDEVRDLIEKEYDREDSVANDKWGPAAGITFRKKGCRKAAGWVFFGCASE